MAEKRKETRGAGDGAGRQDRLKAALKANLQKRKEQARRRKAAATGPATDDNQKS
ncbi:MAG: hypothetical protein R3D97_16140 [Paracoccaceae bacterium]